MSPKTFLCSLVPLVFVALGFVWVVWGQLASLGLTWLSDRAISMLARHRG